MEPSNSIVCMLYNIKLTASTLYGRGRSKGVHGSKEPPFSIILGKPEELCSGIKTF